MKINVRVHPRSSQPRIEEGEDGTLQVYVSSPPHGGLANREVIRAVSRRLGVPKSAITVVVGGRSRVKTLEIRE